MWLHRTQKKRLCSSESLLELFLNTATNHPHHINPMQETSGPRKILVILFPAEYSLHRQGSLGATMGLWK